MDNYNLRHGFTDDFGSNISSSDNGILLAHIYGMNEMDRYSKLKSLVYLIEAINSGATSVIMSGNKKVI